MNSVIEQFSISTRPVLTNRIGGLAMVFVCSAALLVMGSPALAQHEEQGK